MNHSFPRPFGPKVQNQCYYFFIFYDLSIFISILKSLLFYYKSIKSNINLMGPIYSVASKTSLNTTVHSCKKSLGSSMQYNLNFSLRWMKREIQFQFLEKCCNGLGNTIHEPTRAEGNITSVQGKEARGMGTKVKSCTKTAVYPYSYPSSNQILR